MNVKIVWDPEKAESNVKKHGVRFHDVEPVLYDPVAVTVEDERAHGEQRFVTIGVDGLGRILVVVFTWRKDRIRIISARKATPRERKEYGSTP